MTNKEPKKSEGQCFEKAIDNRYQLQASDAIRDMIVTKTHDRANYHAWNRAMQISLGAREELDFINGTCKAPTYQNAKEYRLWKKADYMVCSWIMSSISKEISDNFLYASSAHEIWSIINTRFGGSNDYLIFKKKFVTLRREIIV